MARQAVYTPPPRQVQRAVSPEERPAAADVDEDEGDPTRVDRPEPAGDVAALAGEPGKLQTLKNTIPGEALLLWAWLESTAELYDPPLWAFWGFLVLATVATPVYVYRSIESGDDEETADDESDLRWWQEANVQWQSLSAMGAFVVWVYYLGGPFAAAGLQDEGIAAIMIGLYPVLILITPYYGSFVLFKAKQVRNRLRPGASPG